jgi:hypothetical protein
VTGYDKADTVESIDDIEGFQHPDFEASAGF